MQTMIQSGQFDIREVAEMLDGCSIGEEVSREFSRELKAAGVVVVFGASDDLIEFRGAIYDEDYGPGDVMLTRSGLMRSECDAGEACPSFQALLKSTNKAMITASWCPAGDPDNPCWAYETRIPHATFKVTEGQEVYCRGIVFRLADLP